MRVLSGKRYNPAEPILFGKSGYRLAKDILCSNTMAGHFSHIPNSKYSSYYGRLTLSVVNWTYRKHGELRR